MPVSRLQQELNGLRQDRKALINCETIEDIEAVEWYYFNVPRIVKQQMGLGQTLEESIDSMLDTIHEYIKKTKQEIVQSREYAAKKAQVFETLHDLSDRYELVDITESKLIFNPPEGATHEDCIHFVDDVVNLVNGKYVFTGRGGSWTRWDLKSDSGVNLQAGWEGNGLWSVNV